VTYDWTQSLLVMKHLVLTTSLDRLPPSASQGQGQGRATRQLVILGRGVGDIGRYLANLYYI